MVSNENCAVKEEAGENSMEVPVGMLYTGSIPGLSLPYPLMSASITPLYLLYKSIKMGSKETSHNRLSIIYYKANKAQSFNSP
jgi:hypothetical protein